MPFKVVQTLERGHKLLSCVPEEWEKDGVLLWPKSKVQKLLKMENSVPNQDWLQMTCEVKRRSLTYKEAQLVITIMSEYTDTDIAAECINDNLRPSTSNSHAKPADIFDSQQQDTIQMFIMQDIQTVINNQADILKKLNSVLDFQNKFALKLTSLSVQLEEAKASICNIIEKPVNITLLEGTIKDEENERLYIKNIENQQQLDTFEIDLADMAKKRNYFKTLSLLCSSSLSGGITCAYKLIDVLFSREFLCKCSWSGGSMGHISKIPLKTYKNFRIFFFEIVNSWDSSFTDDDAEKFLKQITRNATKRKAMQGLRQSAKRTRKSKDCIDHDNGICNKQPKTALARTISDEQLELC